LRPTTLCRGLSQRPLALVIGGQYDSPLAREDVSERFRTSAAGMFFVGLRGNILWGGPAAAAVLTHGLTPAPGRSALIRNPDAAAGCASRALVDVYVDRS
jgi:hypothetical protein